MKPVATALDILQGEKNMFLGFLLPTIFIVKDQLRGMLPTVEHCGPLIEALQDGLDKRFGHFLTDKRHILSTITLPYFKNLDFLGQDQETKDNFKRKLIQRIQVSTTYSNTAIINYLSSPKSM